MFQKRKDKTNKKSKIYVRSLEILPRLMLGKYWTGIRKKKSAKQDLEDLYWYKLYNILLLNFMHNISL